MESGISERRSVVSAIVKERPKKCERKKFLTGNK
jgi:hypothetical protein